MLFRMYNTNITNSETVCIFWPCSRTVSVMNVPANASIELPLNIEHLNVLPVVSHQVVDDLGNAKAMDPPTTTTETWYFLRWYKSRWYSSSYSSCCLYWSWITFYHQAKVCYTKWFVGVGSRERWQWKKCICYCDMWKMKHYKPVKR